MKKKHGLEQIAAGIFEYPPKITRLPDGTLMAFVSKKKDPERMVYARYSKDNGENWSELEPQFDLMKLPGDLPYVVESVLDRQGETQVFMLAQYQPDARGDGERSGAGRAQREACAGREMNHNA